MSMSKRILTVAIMLSCVAAWSFAQDQAYSVNSIAAIKKTVPAGNMVLLSVPLDIGEAEDGVRFGDISGLQSVPSGTAVNFWDAETQSWIPYSYAPRGGWGDVSNRVIARGEAFFIQNKGTTDFNVILQGEVPLEEMRAADVAGSGALNLLGNFYPVEQTFGEMAVASDTQQSGSKVNFWDAETQTWVPYSYAPRGGWGNASNQVINPGEGFFLSPVGENSVWEEEIPYSF